MDTDKLKSNLDLVYPPIPPELSTWQQFKRRYCHLILLHSKHPKTVEYFKSEIAILKEKKRHYDTPNYRYTIHPLSKFNRIYEVVAFFFYGVQLFFKTFDFAFIRINIKDILSAYRSPLLLDIILDVLSLMNVALQFFIGFTLPNLRYVELSRSKITLRYLTNGHFFCDVLSSIPRLVTWESHPIVYSIVLSMTMLKLRRITTFVSLIKPAATFFRIGSNTSQFLIGFIFIVTLIMHVMTCFHVGIARYRIIFNMYYTNMSYVTGYFITLPTSRQYVMTFFKSAQYTLLIDMPHFREHTMSEELTFCILNYIVGKLLVAVIWMVLLYMFLSSRILRIKFEEVMTELREYMIAKQLPNDLRNRLLSYYRYKYQNVFFNEVYIRNILSDNLKKEIDVFLCQSLIKQVAIFSHIPSTAVMTIVAHLIPEIYLPNDLIIQSATYGDCMYFIESGTVAVITPSGREICHLNDGAYFGEISILIKDQKRTASIVAIEATKIFKLKKESFDICFKKHHQAYQMLLEGAKKRIEETKEIELRYKNVLFDQSYGHDK